jgi:branched-chain amino acid transport system permease protein
MTTVNIYIIPGLVVGCVYAIAASGLVLSYTTSGVLNLGFGAIAYAIALVFYELHTLHHTLSAWVAFVLCVFVIGPVLGMVLWQVLFRWLVGLGLVASLIATIGLAIALPALCLMIFNPGQIFYAQGLSADGLELRHIGGATMSTDQIYAAAAAVVVGISLFVLLRFTLVGLKMRAVFDSPVVASLTGASPSAISNLSWALSGSLAAVAGIVLAPLLGLSPAVFLSLTVGSLAAALVGGLRSVAVTFVAAIAIGLAGSAVIYLNQSSALLAAGARPALPFIVMAAVLLLRRRPIAPGQPPRRALEPPERFDGWMGVARKVVPAVALMAIAPALLNDYWTTIGSLGLIYALIFLSYTLALGYAGLLPLGQTALVGIGGFVAGQLAAERGVPLMSSLFIGAIAAAVVGGALAAVGARLGTLEFGLLTLAFGLFADNFLFNWGTLVPREVGVRFETPTLFGFEFDSTNSLYYLFLVPLVVVLAWFAWYRRRTGAFYVGAVRMNPQLASATGVQPRTGRIVAFALASGIAGLGGGLFGIYQQILGSANVPTAVGLVWLAVVVMMGIRSPTAAVIAGLVYAYFPALISEWLPVRWGPLTIVLFGAGALALAQDPRGVVTMYASQLSSAFGALRTRLVRARATA